MRSSIVQRILDELTPEKLEEMRLRRKAYVESMSAELQLGFFVGEYIVSNFLPSLSIDRPNDKKTVIVSNEDVAEYERIESKIPFTRNKLDSTTEWSEYIAFRKKLYEKYLPHVLECHIRPLNITNESEFKEGVKRALWDSDRCNYKCGVDDIIIEYDNQYDYTLVKLNLDLD